MFAMYNVYHQYSSPNNQQIHNLDLNVKIQKCVPIYQILLQTEFNQNSNPGAIQNSGLSPKNNAHNILMVVGH